MKVFQFFFKIIVCVFIFSECAFSKNTALIIGGGGELTVENQQWLFGSEVTNIDSGLSGWNKRILFGNSQENKIKKDNTLTYENLESELDSLIQTSNESDQVLIYISSHGFASDLEEYNDKSNPNTHTIAMSRPETSSKEFFSTYKLKKYIEILQAKNIKVAVVNSSCYSGDSLKYFSDLKPFCMLTIAGNQTHGFKGGFSDILSGSLSKIRGKTVAWDPDKGNGNKINLPLVNTKAIEENSNAISLLNLSAESMKLDSLNSENSVLGFDLNSNGHFDETLKSEGFLDFKNKTEKWLNKNCNTLKHCNLKSSGISENCKKINCRLIENLFNEFKTKEKKYAQVLNQHKDAEKYFSKINDDFFDLTDLLIKTNPEYKNIDKICKLKNKFNDCKIFLDKLPIDPNLKQKILVSFKGSKDAYEEKLKLEKLVNNLKKEIILITNQIKGHALMAEKNQNSNLRACHEFKL